MLRRIAWVVLVGCGSSAAPDPPEEPPRPPPAPPRPPPAPPRPLVVRWGKVTDTQPCFYFSGPDGRDDKLVGEATVERHDRDVTLHVGSAAFAGTVNGSDVSLSRTSTHEFNGMWQVTETIRGTHHEGVLTARYHYGECGPDDCPGHCTLDAELTIAR